CSSLHKVGGGQLELSGSIPNTFSGAVAIKQGTLLLNKPNAVTALASGNIIIGDDVSSPDDTAAKATLRFGASNQISGAPALQVASDGLVDISSGTRDFGNITMEVGPLGGATINLGAGPLNLCGAGHGRARARNSV